MASTRKLLESLDDNFSDSVGVRKVDLKPVLSPIASQKDAGRRPVRQFGRIAVDQVIPDPDQPRLEFDADAIERLAKTRQRRPRLKHIQL